MRKKRGVQQYTPSNLTGSLLAPATLGMRDPQATIDDLEFGHYLFLLIRASHQYTPGR
jgi:hypothetical protein